MRNQLNDLEGLITLKNQFQEKIKEQQDVLTLFQTMVSLADALGDVPAHIRIIGEFTEEHGNTSIDIYNKYLLQIETEITLLKATMES